MFEVKYRPETKIHIVCDNIRSAFNIGSIFRTADSTGVAEIHLCGISPQVDNPKVLKTALGSLKSVKSTYHKNIEELIAEFKERKIPIYSIELQPASKHFQEVEYPDEVALVLGHEILGVNQRFIDNSEELIYIPMNGIKESLNVANTASIILFEVLRNKRV